MPLDVPSPHTPVRLALVLSRIHRVKPELIGEVNF
jgi:hypothetical protein